MWALISWIIVGHPFEQFSSQYGTAAQLGAAGQSLTESRGGIAAPRYVLLQLAGLAPMLPIAALGAVHSMVRRRDLRGLAPAAILGGVVAFAVVAFLGGQTAGWFRYYVAVVPLTVLLAGAALARPTARRARWPWLRRLVACLLALAVTGPAVVTSAVVMTDHHLGREEHEHLGFIIDKHPDAIAYQERNRFQSAESVASYLDRRHLRRGSVIMDTFTPCVPFVALASRRPDQFVITNDRDFKPILADPVTFDAAYVLVPPPGGLGGLDEINRTYPTLYENGGGIARLEHEFDGGGCPAFRLYRLNATA
jgi:hypothetical protein